MSTAEREQTSAEETPKDLNEDDFSPCDDQPLEARLEVLLLASDRPLTDSRISSLLGLAGEDARSPQISEAVDSLNQAYESTGRTFRIEAVAGGRQMLTLPEFSPVREQLLRAKADAGSSQLSSAAMETLSIIAYRQPIVRADIEAIRGVACGDILRTLLQHRLVKITGRAEELGRPMLYGTTREFLKVFGLSGLDDLPQAQDLG